MEASLTEELKMPTSPHVTSDDVVHPPHVWSDAAEALHHLPVVVLHPARGRHPQPHQAGQDQPAVNLGISRVCFGTINPYPECIVTVLLELCVARTQSQAKVSQRGGERGLNCLDNWRCAAAPQ